MLALIFNPASGTDAPVAAFVGSPLSGRAPLTTQFTDQSGNNPTSWHWEKNDSSGWVDFAGTPFAQNPAEVFSAGTYSIRLTVTNAFGSSTVTKTDYIVASGSPIQPNWNADPGVTGWAAVASAYGWTADPGTDDWAANP